MIKQSENSAIENGRVRHRNDLALSKLGFGAAAIGLTDYLGAYDAAAPENRAQSIASIRTALANGINYFDTAPGYGNGLSEDILGEALDGATVPHFLATKVPLNAEGGVRASLERSLKRLRRDHVDLVQIHGGSYSADQITEILRPSGTLSILQQLRDEGLTRMIGFSSEDSNAGLYALIDSGAFEVMQIAYNLILQHPYEPTRPFGSLFEAKKRGMMITAMRTATSGIFQRWVQLANPDNTFDYSPSLLQFVLSNRLIDVALVGMRTEDIVLSSVDILNDEAGRIDIDALWERYEKP